MKSRIASNPPFSFMSAPIEATRIVTIMVSNIPLVPLPIAEKAVANVREPVIAPATINSRMPTPRTTNTLMPIMASTRTIKYGKA